MDEKLLRVYIKNVTNDDLMTQRIMRVLYPKNESFHHWRCEKGHIFPTLDVTCKYCSAESKNQTSVDIIKEYKKDKKSEILDSLTYLKNKELKSKKDLESIQMLEAVLKNYS